MNWTGNTTKPVMIDENRDKTQPSSKAEVSTAPNMLIVGDAVIRNVGSKSVLKCCLPNAMVTELSKDFPHFLSQQQTIKLIILHVAQEDVHTKQSSLNCWRS